MSVHHSLPTRKEGENLSPPEFNETAIQEAKPAVPLSRFINKNVFSRTSVLIAIVAGLTGGLIGSVLTARYVKNQSGQADSALQAATAKETTNPPPSDDNKPLSEELKRSGYLSKNAPPPEGAKPEAATAPATAPHPPAAKTDESAKQDGQQIAGNQSPSRATESMNVNDQELRRAFHDWFKANQTGDVDRQMNFYNSTVNSFYLWRGVSRSAVQAEKNRVFRHADTIDIEASSPAIQFSPDGQQATIRYRKRYNIAGADVSRKGEVEQELRWRRVDGQWRIVSERDVRVLR